VLAYASRYGQALVDRRLYLPQSWTKDRTRCAKASFPETVEFATKPKMARHGRGGARCRRPMRLRSWLRCLRGGQ
ncbi:MAG: transposase, partial [Mesorhizobium sp.]